MKSMKLLEILSLYRTSDNRVSRQDLAYTLNLDDRTVRFLIAKARKAGIPILSDNKQPGYYLSYEQEDVAAFIAREMMPRKKDIEETINALTKHIKLDDPDQITIDEVD